MLKGKQTIDVCYLGSKVGARLLSASRRVEQRAVFGAYALGPKMCVVPPSYFFPHRSVSFPSLSVIYDGDRLRKVLMQPPNQEVHATTKEIGATEEEIDASTEMRIAPRKPFASASEKDDAPVEKIGSTHDKMDASCEVLDPAEEKAGASADEVDATDDEADATSRKVDAAIRGVDAAEKDEESTNEEVQSANDDVDASDENLDSANVEGLPTKQKALCVRREVGASRTKALSTQNKPVGATEK